MNSLTILTFIKQRWQTLALITVIVMSYAWIRHERNVAADTIAQLNAAHQTDLDKINQDRAVEEQQHAQELQVLQDSISKIQADYAAAQAQLQQQQTQEQTQIVQHYGNDSMGLSQLLASKMGFSVVAPSAQ